MILFCTSFSLYFVILFLIILISLMGRYTLPTKVNRVRFLMDVISPSLGVVCLPSFMGRYTLPTKVNRIRFLMGVISPFLGVVCFTIMGRYTLPTRVNHVRFLLGVNCLLWAFFGMTLGTWYVTPHRGTSSCASSSAGPWVRALLVIRRVPIQSCWEL